MGVGSTCGPDHKLCDHQASNTDTARHDRADKIIIIIITTAVEINSTMLYDLNIPWTPQTTQSELERTLRFSQSLGYNVVALNHTLSAPVQSTITNPIPQLGPVHSSFPPPSQQPQKTTSTTSSITTKLPTTLRRATVVISDPAVNHRLPTLAAAYDLLAARPTTEKAFLAACTTMSEISLISLDLTTSFPFHFRPKPCMAAVNRGVLFEICYGQLFPSSSTTATTPNQGSRARALFIGNVIEIFRATRGRGIIFSSEASPRNGGGTLRAPADVVNLFAVWGLSNEKGLEALGTNPRIVVVNEGLKRRSFRGVVDIVQVEGKVPSDRRGDAAETDGDKNSNDNDKNANSSKKQQQQKQKKNDAQNGQKPSQGGHQNTATNNNNQSQTQRQEGANGKRKHDGGSDQNTTTTTASNPSSTIPGSTNTNKRQAKKMKLAQRAVDAP